MEETQSIEELYASYKPLLFALAYRMLGSVMDAEDAVQEAFLSYNEPKPEPIRNVKAYLCRIVTNRSIDRLRSASKQREVYVGPWLPEPLVAGESTDAAEPAYRYMQKESVSTAYLLLLQQLTWVERAVFILREVLQYEYEEIAGIVEKSPSNCRQIFHRAKRAISGSGDGSGDESKPVRLQEKANGEMVEQFVRALTSGNISKLMNLLTEDAILYSDGGGKVTAAIRPIVGADRITRFLFGILEKVPSNFSFQLAEVNGQTGIVAYAGDQPHNVITFRMEEERIAGVYIVLNPDKLQHLKGGPFCNQPEG